MYLHLDRVDQYIAVVLFRLAQGSPNFLSEGHIR